MTKTGLNCVVGSGIGIGGPHTPDCVWYDALQEHWVAYHESIDQGQEAAVFQRFSVRSEEHTSELQSRP